MSVTYCWDLQVRTYETDREGRVQDSFYLNYLQEAATLASADAGYSMQWYMEHNRLWLIRTMTIRYGISAGLGDALEIKTWVSDMKRVQSNREYDIRRVSDGAQILRARANWVFVDQTAMTPTRVPDEYLTRFGPHDEPQENLDLDIQELQPVPNAPCFVSEYIAQPYDIDRAQHVNNGVYPRWIEGAMAHLLKAIGYPQFHLQPIWRKLDYLRAAQEGDQVRVESQLTGYTDQYLAWAHTISHAGSGEILVKDTMIYCAETAIPSDLIDALIRGR